MSQDSAADQLLQALGKEVIKVFRVYDGSERCVESYEAFSNAVHGAPALKTTYQYDGATTNVLKMKEELSTWDSAWNI